MLIPSERHTAEDLALWGEYEEADLAADPDRLDRLEREAIATIESFRADGAFYCGCSWGKDSLAVLHLLRMSNADAVVVCLTQCGDTPDVKRVRDKYFERFGGWGMYKEVPFTPGPDHDTEVYQLAARITGTDRYLSGVRSGESSERRMSAAVHGISTEKACRPVLRWRASDVFAFAARHGLPLHPAYAMLGGGRWQRDRLRVSALGGPDGRGHGRAEWEREYYGDVLARRGAE